MAANGTTALDAINWGLSTGGAAGSAETTSTLGVDRVDTRVPPDATRLWAAALNNLKAVIVAMSQDFQGGTRLKTRQQSANPFGSSEVGFYADNSGTPLPLFSATGTLSYLQTMTGIKPGVGAVLASATTIAPTNYIHHVSGTTAVVNITAPANFTGTIVLIPDAAFTTTNAGNIYIASTAVISKALLMTYDGTKWAPSY